MSGISKRIRTANNSVAMRLERRIKKNKNQRAAEKKERRTTHAKEQPSISGGGGTNPDLVIQRLPKPKLKLPKIAQALKGQMGIQNFFSRVSTPLTNLDRVRLSQRSVTSPVEAEGDLSALLATPWKPPSRRRKGHSRRGTSAKPQVSRRKRKGPHGGITANPTIATTPMTVTFSKGTSQYTVIDDVVIIRDSSVESESVGSSHSSEWSDEPTDGSIAEFLASETGESGSSSSDSETEEETSAAIQPRRVQRSKERTLQNRRSLDPASDGESSASDDSYQCVDQLDGTQIAYRRNRRKNRTWTRSDAPLQKKDNQKLQTRSLGTRIPTSKERQGLEGETLPLTAAFSSFTIPPGGNRRENSHPTLTTATNSPSITTPPRVPRSPPRSPQPPLLPQATAIFEYSEDAPVALFSRFKHILAITRDAGVDLAPGVNFHAFASLPLDIQEDQIVQILSYLPTGNQADFLDSGERPQCHPPPSIRPMELKMYEALADTARNQLQSDVKSETWKGLEKFYASYDQTLTRHPWRAFRTNVNRKPTEVSDFPRTSSPRIMRQLTSQKAVPMSSSSSSSSSSSAQVHSFPSNIMSQGSDPHPSSSSSSSASVTSSAFRHPPVTTQPLPGDFEIAFDTWYHSRPEDSYQPEEAILTTFRIEWITQAPFQQIPVEDIAEVFLNLEANSETLIFHTLPDTTLWTAARLIYRLTPKEAIDQLTEQAHATKGNRPVVWNFNPPTKQPAQQTEIPMVEPKKKGRPTNAERAERQLRERPTQSTPLPNRAQLVNPSHLALPNLGPNLTREEFKEPYLRRKLFQNQDFYVIWDSISKMWGKPQFWALTNLALMAKLLHPLENTTIQITSLEPEGYVLYGIPSPYDMEHLFLNLPAQWPQERRTLALDIISSIKAIFRNLREDLYYHKQEEDVDLGQTAMRLIEEYIRNPWEDSIVYPELTDRATEVAERLMRMQFVTMSEIMISINNNAPLRTARVKSASGKELPNERDSRATFPDMLNRRINNIFLDGRAIDPPPDPPTIPAEKLPWQERYRIIPKGVLSTGKRMQELSEAKAIKTDILYDEGLLCDAWLDYIEYTMSLTPAIYTRQGYVTGLIADIFDRIEKGSAIPQDSDEATRPQDVRGIATPARTAVLSKHRLISDEMESYSYAIWEIFRETFHLNAATKYYFTVPEAIRTIENVGRKRYSVGDDLINHIERKDEATAIEMLIAYVESIPTFRKIYQSIITKVFHFPYLHEPLKTEDIRHFQDPASRLRTSPIYPHHSSSNIAFHCSPLHTSPSAYPTNSPHSTRPSPSSPLAPVGDTSVTLLPSLPPYHDPSILPIPIPPPPPPQPPPLPPLSKPTPMNSLRTPLEYEALVIKELQTRLKDSHKVVSQLIAMNLTGTVAVIDTRKLLQAHLILNFTDWKNSATNAAKETFQYFAHIKTILTFQMNTYEAFARFIEVENQIIRNPIFHMTVQREYANSQQAVGSTDPRWRRDGYTLPSTPTEEAIFLLVRFQLCLLDEHKTIVSQTTRDFQMAHCRLREIDGADMALIFGHVATELFPAMSVSKDRDENYYGQLVGRLEALLADLDKTLMSKDKENQKDALSLRVQFKSKLTEVKAETPDMVNTNELKFQQMIQAAARVSTEAHTARRDANPNYIAQNKVYLPRSVEEANQWHHLKLNYPPYTQLQGGGTKPISMTSLMTDFMKVRNRPSRATQPPVAFTAFLAEHGYTSIDETASIPSSLVLHMQDQGYEMDILPTEDAVINQTNPPIDSLFTFFSRNQSKYIPRTRPIPPEGVCASCFNPVSRFHCMPPACSLCTTGQDDKQYVNPDQIAYRCLDTGEEGVKAIFDNLKKGALFQVEDKGVQLRLFLTIANLTVLTRLRKGQQPTQEEQNRVLCFQQAITDYNKETQKKKQAQQARQQPIIRSNAVTLIPPKGIKQLAPEYLDYNPSNEVKMASFITSMRVSDERWGSQRDINDMDVIAEEIAGHEAALARFRAVQRKPSITFHTRQLQRWKEHQARVHAHYQMAIPTISSFAVITRSATPAPIKPSPSPSPPLTHHAPITPSNQQKRGPGRPAKTTAPIVPTHASATPRPAPSSNPRLPNPPPTLIKTLPIPTNIRSASPSPMQLRPSSPSPQKANPTKVTFNTPSTTILRPPEPRLNGSPPRRANLDSDSWDTSDLAPLLKDFPQWIRMLITITKPRISQKDTSRILKGIQTAPAIFSSLENFAKALGKSNITMQDISITDIASFLNIPLPLTPQQTIQEPSPPLPNPPSVTLQGTRPVPQPDGDDPVGRSSNSSSASTSPVSNSLPTLTTPAIQPFPRTTNGGGRSPTPSYANRCPQHIPDHPQIEAVDPPIMRELLASETDTLMMDIRGIAPEFNTSPSIPNPGNCLVGIQCRVHSKDSPYVRQFKEGATLAHRNRWKDISDPMEVQNTYQIPSRHLDAQLFTRPNPAPTIVESKFALFDIGAQGSVISSEVLRKNNIVIPVKERRQVRLLGVQGQATIQDKVVIVFELFGNRVGMDGRERASFSIKDSFLLQVEAIVVDDPNVTMLLGMQEAVKAELVFHAQSGRIMRMIQPHGANIHIYQATTIFTTGFLNGSTNSVPPEEEDAWNMTLQDGNDYERRSADELLSFNQVYLHGVCNGEQLDQSRNSRNQSRDPCYLTMEQVQEKCTPTILINVAAQLEKESGIFLDSIHRDPVVPRLMELRLKWRQTMEHINSIQLADNNGVTSKQTSLELARTLWSLSDSQDKELDPSDFHYLVTCELLDSPDTLA